MTAPYQRTSALLGPGVAPSESRQHRQHRQSRRPGGRRGVLLLGGLLALAVATGMVLRFRVDSPLWLDEAQSVAIARLPLHRLPEALRHDGSPPLYYVCLHLWMEVFGTGDAAVRSLSGVCGVLTLPLLWRWGTAVGGSRLGLTALGLAAANPWLIRYASETRMYAMVVLLTLLFALALRRLRSHPGAASAGAVGALGGLLLLTHYWAIFLLAATGAAWALRRLLRGAHPADPWGLAALALSAVVFLPWMPAFVYQLHHTGTPWAGKPHWLKLTTLVAHWSSAGRPPDALLASLGPLLLWVTLLAGLCLRQRADGRLVPAGRVRSPVDPPAFVTVVTLALAFTACRISPAAFSSRYTAVVVAPVLLLAAFGTTLLPRRVAFPVVATLMAAWLAVSAFDTTLPRTQAGQIAAVLNERAAAGDVIVFCPDQLGPAVTRLLHTPATSLAYPEGRDPAVVDWADYARRNQAAVSRAFAARLLDRTPAHGRIWLVAHGGYRTFGHQCADLRHTLAAALGPGKRHIAPDPRAAERAGLFSYRRA